MLVTCWVDRSSLFLAKKSCAEHYPNESGGLIFGYKANDREFVVNHISKPGPQATHGPIGFVPDYEHDTSYSEILFQESNGQSRYLGDWHSHPKTERSYLSRADKQALKNILHSDEASLVTVLAIVFAGSEQDWTPCAWAAELVKRLYFFEALAVVKAEIKLFD